MSLPTFRFEKPFWKKGCLVVGIDEVGRGALAGPLIVGAVCFNPHYQARYNLSNDLATQILSHESLPAKTQALESEKFAFASSKLKSAKQVSSLTDIEELRIDDSKKLSPKKRERLAKIIKKIAITATASSPVSLINRLGIVGATQKAARGAIRAIIKRINLTYPQRPLWIGKSGGKIFLLLDAFYVKHVKGVGLKNQKAIIHGDAKSISIAAASIIAKVYRDRLMRHLALKYPRYHWEKNKGYGTREHIKALKKYGKTKLHRDLFLRKIITKT
jgi:ribonuclease HII